MKTLYFCLIVIFHSIGSLQSQTKSELAAIDPSKAKLPPLATMTTPGYLSGNLIYELANRPTPECHASTIVETATGIVAAWFAGTEEGDQDVAIRVARFNGHKWLPSIEIADGSENEDKEYPCWNPVLFQPENGPLMLFYKVGPSPSMWWGALATSEDGGKTWELHGRLGTKKELGQPNINLIGPVRSKPIQLADGSILCPSSSEHDKWRVHFEITKDLGKTWELIPPINNGSAFNAIQPTIMKHKNGALQILCRTKEKVLAQSWSQDKGRTWSKLSSSNLPNPNAGADAVTLDDGNQLLVYNHSWRTLGKNGRQIINVALSRDGKKWKTVMTLEQQDNRAGYSYPAVIQSDDGLVHITYTWRRIGIKHVILDPNKLL